MRDREARLLPVVTVVHYLALAGLPVCSALFLLISVNFSPTRSVSVGMMTITAAGVAIGQVLIMTLHAGVAFRLGARPLKILVHALIMLPIAVTTYLFTLVLFVLVYPHVGAAPA